MPLKERQSECIFLIIQSLGTCLQPVGMFAEMEKKFSGFTEWQHSLYHPSLRVTRAYDMSLTLFMPLAAEHTFYHGSASPSLVLPVYDDFLQSSVALLALFQQM